ncbi:MAG TPA: glycoside hydrolase family 32 protein [Balneolaceae bacterium]|nr:glycoside hydrolase family 32 protein [Balneolaceae bacterium]
MSLNKKLLHIIQQFLALVILSSLIFPSFAYCQAQSDSLQTAPTNKPNPFRPQFHFTPAKNWTNDPNGLVYFDGEYHLFFQYNPFGNKWGHMSWGHAVSSDMIHWKQLPVAIPEANNEMIFSGSAVVDSNNTSGFGKNGKIPMVAIYAGYNTKTHIQDQRLAYSLDHGHTWTKFKGNPVITLHSKNFRDPKVFWYAPDKEWIMVVALSAQHKVRFYRSPDLIHWKKLSDFGPQGATEGNWECPILSKVHVKNEPSQKKWVLEISGKIDSVQNGLYFVGNFNGKTFIPDPAFKDNPHRVDYGMDFYAATSWANIPASDGRTLWLAWMDNWQYAQQAPTHPFRGMMTVPRSITLQKGDDSYYLLQNPVKELHSLRGQHFHFSNLAIHSGKLSLSKKGITGTSVEIQATLKPSTAKKIGFIVRKGKNQQTVIGYKPNQNELYVNRTHSGRDQFSKAFPGGIQSAPLRLENGLIHLHILVDRSSVEVFANEGKRVITDDIYPRLSSDGLQLFARGGTLKISSLDIWKLHSYRK